MSKKAFIISVLIAITITFAIVGLYNTYAYYTSYNSVGDQFSLLPDTSSITLTSGEERTIIYKVENTNNGTVNYAVGYSGDDITVKYYEDTYDPVSGTLYKGENKFIKLYIVNSGNSSGTCTLSTVLGYENGGNLVVPSGVTLVTDAYYSGIAGTISNLFFPNTTVTNNSITYQVDTSSQLIKDTNGNIRFYGSSPDNYIYFNCDSYPATNCETWRVIGVVDGRLKTMRATTIGAYVYDTSPTGQNGAHGYNEWSQSNLIKILNPGFENYQSINNTGATITVSNSVYYTSSSGICYGNTNVRTKACDFTSSGVQGIKNDATRNKIAEAVYYLGGSAGNSDSFLPLYPDEVLIQEHGSAVGNNTGDTVPRNTRWRSKIAIPNASDYGYAADLSLCVDKKLSEYNDSTCKTNNWMATIMAGLSTNSWILNPNSGENKSERNLAVRSSGLVYTNFYNTNNYNVFPTLYLSNDEEICGGSGSSGDPWRLCA